MKSDPKAFLVIVIHHNLVTIYLLLALAHRISILIALNHWLTTFLKLIIQIVIYSLRSCTWSTNPWKWYSMNFNYYLASIRYTCHARFICSIHRELYSSKHNYNEAVNHSSMERLEYERIFTITLTAYKATGSQLVSDFLL